MKPISIKTKKILATALLIATVATASFVGKNKTDQAVAKETISQTSTKTIAMASKETKKNNKSSKEIPVKEVTAIKIASKTSSEASSEISSIAKTFLEKVTPSKEESEATPEESISSETKVTEIAKKAVTKPEKKSVVIAKAKTPKAKETAKVKHQNDGLPSADQILSASKVEHGQKAVWEKKATTPTKPKVAKASNTPVKKQVEKTSSPKEEAPQAPKPKKKVTVTTKPSKKKPNLAVVRSNQRNNSIILNGIEFPITNDNTQARIDSYRKEVVNWYPNYTNYKTVGDGHALYLAVHMQPYGKNVYNANSLTFKDCNGNTKKYYLSKVFGPYGNPAHQHADEEYNELYSLAQGRYGDGIAVQTCIDGWGTFQTWFFRP